MEHFKQFEGLTALDRKTVAHLIRSIRVVSKTELQITFNYQAEYEKVLSLLNHSADSSGIIEPVTASNRMSLAACDEANSTQTAMLAGTEVA
jgi:hypothetical protein